MKAKFEIGHRKPPWIVENEHGITTSSYKPEKPFEQSRWSFLKFIVQLREEGEEIRIITD